MLANRNLDIGFGSYTQEALSDRDRLLRGIEPDFEHLLRSFELTDQPLELTLLLLTLARRGTQLAWPLTSFVH